MQKKSFLILISFGIFLNSCSIEKKYIKHNKFFEKDISNLEQKNSKIQTKDYLLFIGSSSIVRWETIKKDMYPYKVIRNGYGGAHYYDLIHFIERICKGHEKAKAIFIFVANDITGVEFGNHRDLKPREVKKLFKSVYKKIRNKLGDKIPIYVIETTPTPSRWDVWEKIKSTNDLIMSYTEKENELFYITTRDYFLNDNGTPISNYFVDDQLHLNDLGYKIWSKVIKNKIKNPQ
tara:strand:- start:64 stop:765 length:702 start_codon:yes stop_codon:yes gene_type:complete